MKKMIKSNSDETYYYPVKRTKSLKLGLIISLSLLAIFFILKILLNNDPGSTDAKNNFTFEDISSIKDSKNRHIDYYEQILKSEKEVIEKTKERKIVDSLYFIKIIDLLSSQRKDIFNSNFTFQDKLQKINSIIEDYNVNRLIIDGHLDYKSKLENELETINSDLKLYQNEIIWSKRNIKVKQNIDAYLEDNATGYLNNILTTKVISSNVKLIDSILQNSIADNKSITYTYYIERIYKTSTGTWKYSGLGKWEVSLNSNYNSDIQVKLIENGFKDIRVN
jgi:hypothetical protein